MIDSNQFQNPIEIASEAPFKSAIANRHRDTTKAKKRAGKAPLPRYALSTINQAPNTAQENTHRKTSLSIDTTPHICHTEHSTTIASKIQIWTKAMKNPTLTITMNSSNQMIVRNERGNHSIIPLTITGLSTLRDLLGEEKRSIQTMIDEFYAKQEKESMDEIKEMF